MNNRVRQMTQASVLAALYVVLTHAQNLLFPGSASMMIQFRLSEALGVMAFFTPAAIPGLTVGCLLFNLSSAGALPFDWLVGTAATLLATAFMWRTRKLTFRGIPWLGLLMPALFNAPLVGWELAFCIAPGGFTLTVFALNALYVFIGEAVVMLIAGSALYWAITSRGLNKSFF